MTERELFLQALDIQDPAERAAFLDRACKDQPDLRAQVDQLLWAHEQAGPFLAHPRTVPGAVPTEAFVAEVSSADEAGMLIAGKYKLLQRIGEGGMGSVWMADQLEPVKRRVAVKLVRADREGFQNMLSRFEAERQAIALMDHPNIAKVLDAGTTQTEWRGVRLERPFFVMELVKGVPLTQFCDEHRLSIPDRLGLFILICGAVQHAHQKGIIHRDLKPTNVLIEMHDDKPVPKVIDFGLAKALSGQPLTERTLFTAFGTIAGTPLYMAPEQARLNAIDIDTRADIYALGVILYELLTSSTPIERETLKKAAFDEVMRLIRESEPPTPSKRISSSAAKPSVAANRHTEPAKLGRFIRGELDWIVMKALAKERDRRYETAGGFAKDVERFLNHEPVQAGPPSASYRIRKFVQRHRSQVIAGSLILSAMLAGIVGTTIGLIRTEEQRRLAKANEARATEAAIAERQARQRAEQAEVTAKSERDAATLAKSKETMARNVAERKQQEADHEKRVAQELEAKNRQQLVRLKIANGIRLIDEGDWFGALLWLAQALEETRDDPKSERMQRIRIASLLNHCPRLLQSWHYSQEIISAEWSADGRRVLVVTDAAVEIRDALTGNPIVFLSSAEACFLDPDHSSASLTGFRIAALSPDGSSFVTVQDQATDDGPTGGIVRVWDAQNGKPLTGVIHHHCHINHVSFSADGKQVLTSSGNENKGDVRILDARSGTLVGHVLEHPEAVLEAYFTPNGRSVVTRSRRLHASFASSGLTTQLRQVGPTKLRVWDGASGRLKCGPLDPGGPAKIRCGPYGCRIVAYVLGHMRVWESIEDTLTSREIHVPNIADFSPDGNRALTAGERAEVWDAMNGKLLNAIRDSESQVERATFSPDGLMIATIQSDHKARLWNVNSGRPLTPWLRHIATLDRGVFSPDGCRFMLTGVTELRIWTVDPATPSVGDPLASVPLWDFWTHFDRCGTHFTKVVSQAGKSIIQIIDASTLQPTVSFAVPDKCVAISASPTLDFIVLAGMHGPLLSWPAQAFEVPRVWDTVTGKSIGEPLKMCGPITRASLSPDATQLLTVDANKLQEQK
jgi:serine/threonine protein kinase/WD40 repeat protein